MSVENIRKVQENTAALYTEKNSAGKRNQKVRICLFGEVEASSSPGWHEARKAIRTNFIRIPQTERRRDAIRTPSGRNTLHSWTSHPDYSISFPDMLSGWKTLTKASKPCNFFPKACHIPRSAVLQWCVRTPCSDIFAMDSKEFSLISDCFGDQKAIKTPKLNTIWLELITRVFNMLIGLKGDNYYSKVFKRVNHKLSNSTFWVVINDNREPSFQVTQDGIAHRLQNILNHYYGLKRNQAWKFELHIEF